MKAHHNSWTGRIDGALSGLRSAFMLVLWSLLGDTQAAAVCPPCDQVMTFADGRAPSSVLHVATGGSNTDGNGSAANPFATIAFAATQATPGTAICVHGGTYAGGGFIYDLSGSATAPIWIGGAPGEARPVINGGSEGLHFVRARYVILHDLEFQNAANNGINCDDGGEYANPLATHHLLFRNLYIHDIGGTGNQDGLKLSGVNDYVVLDCEIAHCGGNSSGSGIDHVGCHHGLIARCYFHELSANAVQCKSGSEDIEIRWCRMVEAGERAVNIGGSTGFQFFRPPLSTTEPNFEARDIRVVSNLIQGATASIAYVGCVDCVVSNNTMVDPHNWILRILQETVSGGGYTFLPCGNNTFRNNLVYFDRSDLSTYVNIGPNTAPSTFTFAHNLWYAHDNPSLSAPNLPVAETGGIIGQNPLLADPQGGDFAIGPGSPAAAAGQSPAGAAADILAQCYRAPPSIGAYQALLPVMPGDLDADGDVDLCDAAAVVSCLSGPISAIPPAGCDPAIFEGADLTNDGDVDCADAALLLANFGD